MYLFVNIISLKFVFLNMILYNIFMKKIALTGGGTAGHITPNLALIPELEKRNFDVIYIGSKTGMEKDIIERRNIPYFGVTADKLRRYIDVKNLVMPMNVIFGIRQAKKILKENKVDILFSKGGFVSVPVVIAASQLGIPIISHEADFTPGLANKIAAPFSKIICTNFEETAKMFGKKGVHTGCPIRQRLLDGKKEKGLEFLDFNTTKPIMFVTGGSLGSKYINDLIRSNLDKLLDKMNIVHSCGQGKYEKDLEYRIGYKQFELIRDELPDVLAASGVIVSRAGANILFELLALKKLNLLIPLTTKASRGDQILNAKSFSKKNYSIVLNEEDQDKNPNLFFEKLAELNRRRDELIEAMSKSKTINAVKTICDIIEKEA